MSEPKLFFHNSFHLKLDLNSLIAPQPTLNFFPHFSLQNDAKSGFISVIVKHKILLWGSIFLVHLEKK